MPQGHLSFFCSRLLSAFWCHFFSQSSSTGVSGNVTPGLQEPQKFPSQIYSCTAVEGFSVRSQPCSEYPPPKQALGDNSAAHGCESLLPGWGCRLFLLGRVGVGLVICLVLEVLTRLGAPGLTLPGKQGA